MWRVIVVILVAIGGLWVGKTYFPKEKPFAQVHPEKEFPVVEHKSFVIVVYAHNQALWCERALRSIFEQDYDHYRVVLIDDGSTDGTAEVAKQFIIDNNQSEKVVLLRNQTKLGRIASLSPVVEACLDREIVVPLDAKDWLSSPMTLNQLNGAYQNPDVWVAFGQAIDYPSYKIGEAMQISYYATLFKEIEQVDDYLPLLVEKAGGRVRKLGEPIGFFNTALFRKRNDLF